MEFKGQFDELVMILKRTPNLTNLTINVYDDIDMINANQWEHLITSSLPYLKIFKFKLRYLQKQGIIITEEKLKEFQSDF
jgi:hypothetical protein